MMNESPKGNPKISFCFSHVRDWKRVVERTFAWTARSFRRKMLIDPFLALKRCVGSRKKNGAVLHSASFERVRKCPQSGKSVQRSSHCSDLVFAIRVLSLLGTKECQSEHRARNKRSQSLRDKSRRRAALVTQQQQHRRIKDTKNNVVSRSATARRSTSGRSSRSRFLLYRV